MPLTISAPLEKLFHLANTDAIYDVEGDPTTVTIRQASRKATELRASVYETMTREVFVGDKDSGIVDRVQQRFNYPVLQRKEAEATMVACNITDENGKDLFKFKNGKLAMTSNAFAKAWNKLPDEAAEEIHGFVREMNPTWNVNSGEGG